MLLVAFTITGLGTCNRAWPSTCGCNHLRILEEDPKRIGVYPAAEDMGAQQAVYHQCISADATMYTCV